MLSVCAPGAFSFPASAGSPVLAARPLLVLGGQPVAQPAVPPLPREGAAGTDGRVSVGARCTPSWFVARGAMRLSARPGKSTPEGTTGVPRDLDIPKSLGMRYLHDTSPIFTSRRTRVHPSPGCTPAAQPLPKPLRCPRAVVPTRDAVNFQPFSAIKKLCRGCCFSSKQTYAVLLHDGLFCLQNKQALHQHIKPTQSPSPSLLDSICAGKLGWGCSNSLFGPVSPPVAVRIGVHTRCCPCPGYGAFGERGRCGKVVAKRELGSRGVRN